MHVDHTLRSLCKEIAGRQLTIEEWLHEEDRLAPKPIVRTPYTCSFIGDGDNPADSIFLVECEIRDYPHSARLSLNAIVAIANDEVNDFPLTPNGGTHPEDDGMSRIELDSELVGHAISDAINTYVREVLIPRGVVAEDVWDADKELMNLKYEIAEKVAQKWKVSWRHDDDTQTNGT